MASIWRFFVALFDWRAWKRKIEGRHPVDVCFVTNMRDVVDKKRYLGNYSPPEGHFSGPRYWFNGVSGRTRAIDTLTSDLMNGNGRRRAKKQVINAVSWAQENGAKVILLAAGTKRLFGKDGGDLKKKFPELIFTIGDNGTAFLLQRDVERALNGAELKPTESRIGVLCPYGFLGEVVTKFLTSAGYNVIGAGDRRGPLEEIKNKYGIEVCSTVLEMGKVDAIVTCTHSNSLTMESIESLRMVGRKILVIDVAEPANLNYDEYQKCDNVIRQDAGNAYSSDLKIVLGPISYKMFRLTSGVIFGCFAEAISIRRALEYDKSVVDLDWLTVNEEATKKIVSLFNKDGIVIPSPRCFGALVKDFNLSI